MANRTKPDKSAPARTTTLTRNEISAELDKLFNQFGWQVDIQQIPALTGPELDAIATWLTEAWSKTPLAVWSLVILPDKQLFGDRKNRNDAMAIVSTVLSHRGEFNAPIGDPVSRLIDSIDESGCHETRFGWIFIESDPELQIWFGRKAGKPPQLWGDAARVAIQTLFNAEITAAPREEPPMHTKAPSGEIAPQIRKAAKRAVPKPTSVEPATGNTMQVIDMRLIDPDAANREMSDKDQSIKDLAANIDAVGLLQPITVRPIPDSVPQRYTITAGERRWRACRLLEYKSIPAIVRETAGVATAVSRISENTLRENLTPIELATEYSRLIDAGKTQAEIGKLFGVTQAQISNTIRLLKLPTQLHQHIGEGEGKIAPTTIRPALPFCDIPEVVIEIEQLINDGQPFTLDDVESYLERAIQKSSRSMQYSATPSNYSKPQKTTRHFKDCTPADLAALDVRKYDNEERAFNVAKFDELNKEPLKKRIDAYKKATAVQKSPEQKKSQPKKMIADYKEYALANMIRKQLANELGAAIEAEKHADTIGRVIWSMAVLGAFDSTFGRRHDASRIPQYFAKLDEVVGDLKLTAKKLQPHASKALADSSMQIAHLQHLASMLNATLATQWRPTKEILELLTDDGLTACRDAAGLEATQTGKPLAARLLKEWPPGLIPPFLQEFFGLPKAKAKKAKAA